MLWLRFYIKTLLRSASDGINGTSLSALALLVLKVAGLATCSWLVVFCYFLFVLTIESASYSSNGILLSALALMVLKVAGLASCSWIVVTCYFLFVLTIENVRELL